MDDETRAQNAERLAATILSASPQAIPGRRPLMALAYLLGRQQGIEADWESNYHGPHSASLGYAMERWIQSGAMAYVVTYDDRAPDPIEGANAVLEVRDRKLLPVASELTIFARGLVNMAIARKAFSVPALILAAKLAWARELVEATPAAGPLPKTAIELARELKWSGLGETEREAAVRLIDALYLY